MLGKLPMQGRPTNFDNGRQGPTALAVGARWVDFGYFSSLSSFPSSFSLSLGDGPI